jgi:CheY-like chemotaxis protein
MPLSGLGLDAPLLALVVDDDHDIRRLVAAFLRHKGFDVETADNGPDAIDLLRRIHVDVVIADFHLSGRCDGIAVLDCHNRMLPEGARILFTADYSEKLPIVCQQINSVYVPKPIPLPDLLFKINEGLPSKSTEHKRRLPLAGIRSE